MTFKRALRAALIGCCATLVLAAPAQAAVKRTVKDSDAKARSCFKRYLGDRAGTEVVRATASQTGLVRARLKGRGDWDVGVFDAKTRRSVAASAGFASNELAEGFVTKGQRLARPGLPVPGQGPLRPRGRELPRRCRRRAAEPSRWWTWSPPTEAARSASRGSGWTSPSTVTPTPWRSCSTGQQDAAKLRSAGLPLHGPDRRSARADAREQARRRAPSPRRPPRSDLPSGRDNYRRLADYELELKQLALRYPKLVKPITLAYRTHLGRNVMGIEIAKQPVRTRATASRSSSTWVCTTLASGPPRSTRSSGRMTCFATTASRTGPRGW